MSDIVVHYDWIDKLFGFYKNSSRTDYLKKVKEYGSPFSETEAILIWQAFDRAAEQWEPRIGGM